MLQSVTMYYDTTLHQYNEQLQSWHLLVQEDSDLFFLYTDSDTTLMYRQPSATVETTYLSRATRIQCDGVLYYQLVFTEDVVGLDYFVLYDVSKAMTYVSAKYNYQTLPYVFDWHGFSIQSQTIVVEYDDGEGREVVHFHPLK